MEAPRSIFSHKPYWAARFGPTPFLPMSKAEMDVLGWDQCDVILVTGDSYIDHPSFGMALIGRLLESQGFRVGILSQPDWSKADSFRALGRPALYFGVTAGNMDSMVNRYTSDRKLRRDDAYTVNGEAGRRPDRAAIVYSQRCREAYPGVPVVLGGIEASLRRFAHYDYWSDKVRGSILLDSKADILLYGNAERALVGMTHRLAKGEALSSMTDLRGAVLPLNGPLEELERGVTIIDASNVDLGAPSANMWNTGCSNPAHQQSCRRSSCLFPNICKNLKTDQTPLISLYRKTRAVPGVKKVVIASGLRYDLALKTPAYIKELATHHVGGYLKVAPEHTEAGPLALMQKPGIEDFEKFKLLFEKFSKEAGKEQYLIPYFIAAHPGSSDEDMLNLALWLKENGFRTDQVQTFLPTPMAAASAMYHSSGNPLAPVTQEGFQPVATAKGLRQRRLHKAFLRWHDTENWPLLREALHDMGRADLIGPGKKCLVPPAVTGGWSSSRLARAGRAEPQRENRNGQGWKRGAAKDAPPASHGEKRKEFSPEKPTDRGKSLGPARNHRGRHSR